MFILGLCVVDAAISNMLRPKPGNIFAAAGGVKQKRQREPRLAADRVRGFKGVTSSSDHEW